MNITTSNLGVSEPNVIYPSSQGITTLPLDVSKELSQYSRLFITDEYDVFRNIHCCESIFGTEYKIYGELPDGDKKVLFTCHRHFECCKCCQGCAIGTICCFYECCDSIVFQLDYKRNGAPFYTQGWNIKKGCYCCTCNCCCCCDFCCCPPDVLYLRENIDPDSPNFDVGKKKGKTKAYGCPCFGCDGCCPNKAEYYTQENNKDQTVKATCDQLCKHCCLAQCFCGGADFEMDIEDSSGVKTGSVKTYAGCCSRKVEGKNCFCPREAYYEVNLPPNATSEQKFQIVADVIHLDLRTNILRTKPMLCCFGLLNF